ncbi:MAG: hypothetical protein NTW54_05385 [Bacteroidetes bacterium]|nr:hypothetical protein [Bacteroidota bacterium]
MSTNKSFEKKIFKLSTGEEVTADALENLIEKTCHYIKYAVVGQNHQDTPVAFIFPNKKLLTYPNYLVTPMEGCFCPRSIDELGKCLSGCMKLVNQKIDQNTDGIKEAAILHSETHPEDAPKLSYPEIIEKYRTLLHQTFGNTVPDEEDIFYIKGIDN